MSTVARRETMNFRVDASDSALIKRAAEVTGKTRTAFVVDAARRAAQEAILDQTLIRVSPEAYDVFLKMLDAPAQPNARLRELLQRKPPWETA